MLPELHSQLTQKAPRRDTRQRTLRSGRRLHVAMRSCVTLCISAELQSGNRTSSILMEESQETSRRQPGQWQGGATPSSCHLLL